MNKKNQMTVENFVSTGMDLDTLYACFQDFPREEIAEIYHRYKDNEPASDDCRNMSINCS